MLFEHNTQYHELDRIAFLGLWFAESFRVLNVFSIVFDSVNSVISVVNSVADEMLRHISTKRHDSGSVVQHRFGQCVFNPPRARRKVSDSITVPLPADTRCVSYRDAVVADRYYRTQFHCFLNRCRRVSAIFPWDSSQNNVGANTYLI